MFLAVNVLSATLFPPPDVPHINIWGFGSWGGPQNVSTYTGEFVNMFLPINTPVLCDKLGFAIGIKVAIPPATIFLS